MIAQRPIVAYKFNGINDYAKEKVLDGAIKRNRGVFGHSNPNVLAANAKNMIAEDLTLTMEAVTIAHVWFMWFGMWFRSFNTHGFGDLEDKIKEEWARLSSLDSLSFDVASIEDVVICVGRSISE